MSIVKITIKQNHKNFARIKLKVNIQPVSQKYIKSSENITQLSLFEPTETMTANSMGNHKTVENNKQSFWRKICSCFNIL